MPRASRGLISTVACVLVLLLGSVPATPAEPPPVIVAVVLDTSGSLKGTDLEAAGALASGLLRALPKGSEAAVFAFADESRLLLERTADIAAVEQAILTLRPTGQRTALYDALYDASRYLHDAPATQRAVVLLTDGRDEGSALSVEDGLKVAQETHIPVFGVGVGRVQERVLRRVAKLTAGDYTPIAETTGGSLAARILVAAAQAAVPETTAPAPPPPSAAPSLAPGGEPIAPADRPRPLPLGWLAGLLFGLAAIVVAVLVVLARRRPEAPHRAPRAALPSAGVPSRAGARTKEASPKAAAAALDEPATVFSRMELGNETVDRTVLLREQAVLEITAGPGKGRVFPLSALSATSMGRARANDVALEDEAISAQHMRIRPEDGRFVLHDLGSTNGTRVNDRRVSRHPLEDGDVIRVGDTSLRFRLSQGK